MQLAGSRAAGASPNAQARRPLPGWLSWLEPLREPVRRYGEYVLGGATLVGMLVTIWAAFIYAPTDVLTNDNQRIFYVHVPMAWLAYLAFFMVFAASIGYLWRKDERWDLLARASAEVGVIFHHAGADHRIAVGPTDLGDVVGMGCAPDDDADHVVYLRGLSAVALIHGALGQWRALGGGAGHHRLRRYSHRPYVGDMVEYAASAANRGGG